VASKKVAILAVVVIMAAIVGVIQYAQIGAGKRSPSNNTTNDNFHLPPAAICKGTADCIDGTITKIVDGDTLDIDNTRIRLTLVNTPEINQAGYEEAKQFTLNLCPLGSKASADEDDGQTSGSYGRVIAKVTCSGGKVLNEELLNAHLAEILTNFCAKSEFRSEAWANKFGCQ
jgi:micrococcal nuclease